MAIETSFTIKQVSVEEALKQAEAKVEGSHMDLVNLIGSAMLADGRLLELVRQALVIVEYMNKENTHDKRTTN